MSTTADNLTIDKYRLVNCLATGHSSQVWEAIDNETTRRVAMKLLLPEALTDAENLSALKHEFKTGRSFDHPNIIKYYEIAAKKKQAYFTMELFPAPSLKMQMYNDLHSVQMRLKRLVELVAMALEHIHERGWLHRDIKPDNILMNKSAEVRLIDFSLASRAAGAFAKMFARKGQTAQGTRTYMAPEQILRKPLTVQTDIYNFGVTLFEIVAGQPPFKGSSPNDLLLRHINEAVPAASEFNPNVTPEMDKLLIRMMSKKPEQRHRKMSEFLVEFRAVQVFKEELTEKLELTEQQKADELLKKILGGGIDSRADAIRTKYGGQSEGPKPKPKPKPAPAKAPAAVQPPRPPAQPVMPPQPMMPMQPMMPVMPMPMAPYPMGPMPQGPNPWVAAGPGGMPGAPWMGQPAPGAPPMAPPGMAVPARPVPPPPAAPARPVPPPAVLPPAAARPTPPPPVLPTGVPAPAPVASPPPKPAPAPAAKAKRPAPAAATKPEEGFKIDDLLGFDELPPAS